MNGVHPDLDLSALVGTELIQVGVGEHQIILAFMPQASITIESSYVLTEADGSVAEAGRPDELRTKCLLELLGETIVSATPKPPSAVEVRFSGGRVLRLIDDSPQYECFSIQPGDIFV
jgi:hypothetical protein